MAALLDIVHLRRHALPAHFMFGLDRMAGPPAAPRRGRDVCPRPRLVAVWTLDLDGRPVCSWSFDTDDPASAFG
ncbi:MAG: hypothetical protein RQ966_20115 [Acetobacteraceae bacterium]|jgi:hypothetical protein|nr:hypothetical protein [Acetobacteraceae bacterium]